MRRPLAEALAGERQGRAFAGGERVSSGSESAECSGMCSSLDLVLDLGTTGDGYTLAAVRTALVLLLGPRVADTAAATLRRAVR